MRSAEEARGAREAVSVVATESMAGAVVEGLDSVETRVPEAGPFDRLRAGSGAPELSSPTLADDEAIGEDGAPGSEGVAYEVVVPVAVGGE